MITHRSTLVPLVFLLFAGCANKDNSAEELSRPKVIKRMYTVQTTHEVKGYTHYVSIDPYIEGQDDAFLSWADDYRDTCKSDVPVENVVFCTPFNFAPAYDSRDIQPLNEHAIVEICYEEETLHHRHPNVRAVAMFSRGHAHWIDLYTKERNDSLFLDSNGAYNRGWIKSFDSVYGTHYSQ